MRVNIKRGASSERRWLATAVIMGTLLLMAVSGLLAATSRAQAQPVPLQITAGVGSGTVAGNVFAPGEVTIPTGTSIIWTIGSDEPHTVTFGQGPADVPPPFWPNTFGIEESPEPKTLTATYDGTNFINTGVIFKGSSVTITFNQAGSFGYFCAIHPGMTGTVNVVPFGRPTTTQAEADEDAQQNASAILAREAGQRAEAAAAFTRQTRTDGTSLWNITAGIGDNPMPVPGGGSGFLELLEFLPPSATIKAGDTVRWVVRSPSPHTVTFLPVGVDPLTLEVSPFDPPTVPSSQYDGRSLYNSGLIGGLATELFGAPDEFELTFPNAGTYQYVCLLHAFPGPGGQLVGMVGTITVEAAALPPQVTTTPTATATATPPPTATVTPRLPETGSAGLSSADNGAGWVIWLALGLGAAVTVGGLSVIARRASD